MSDRGAAGSENGDGDGNRVHLLPSPFSVVAVPLW